jgi:predicted MFS family arabinose efflux permease
MRAALRHPEFRLLVTGMVISQTGDWLYNVALLIFVLDRTHSAGWVAAAGIVRLVPYVLFGTAGGVIADHVDRRTVMVVSDLARAGIMLVLAVVAASSGSPLAAIALAGASTSFAVVYGPSVNAALPGLVGEEDLAAANSIVQMLTNVCIALGPAIGGILLLLGSPAMAFVVNAVTFAGSAVCVLAIRADLGPARRSSSTSAEVEERPPPLRERLAEGMRALASSSDAILVVGVWVIGGFTYGQEIVLYALVAGQRLGMGENGLGFLYASLGVGGIAAASLANRAATRPRQGSTLVLAALIAGTPLVMLAFITAPAAAYAVLAVEGAAMIIVDVLVITTLQRILSAEVLGRAFGAIDSLLVAGMLAGSLIAPFVIRLVGLRAALAIAGGVLMAVSLGILPRGRAIDRRAARRVTALEPRVATLLRLDIFDGATRPTLESLAELLTEETFDAGSVVVREGDRPDDLFVVVAGELDVTASGSDGVEHPVGELGHGDYFGEIGLLRGIPRTATVTVRTRADLYRIPGEDFLRVLNEGPAMSTSLLSNVQTRLSITRSTVRRDEPAG